MKHTPVLLDEVLEAFGGVRLNVFFDGTLGAGGHASALLEAHSEITRYVGCDRDTHAHALAGERLEPWKDKLECVHGNYADIDSHLSELGIDGIDGALLDLGVSSMQLDETMRGFSFSKDAPLDMRMDRSQSLTAKEIVNRWKEGQLEKIFRDYGEISRFRKLAKDLCEARKKRPFETTGELAEWVKKTGGFGRKKIHPATLVFQALRIAVNGELDGAKEGVIKAINLLNQGGRLAVISFHSLEDRIVKNVMRQAANPDYDWEDEKIEGLQKVKLLTKKPICATREETRKNPRARSAKLRVVEAI